MDKKKSGKPKKPIIQKKKQQTIGQPKQKAAKKKDKKQMDKINKNETGGMFFMRTKPKPILSYILHKENAKKLENSIVNFATNPQTWQKGYDFVSNPENQQAFKSTFKTARQYARNKLEDPRIQNNMHHSHHQVFSALLDKGNRPFSQNTHQSHRGIAV